jgi:hypothetical protein
VCLAKVKFSFKFFFNLISDDLGHPSTSIDPPGKENGFVGFMPVVSCFIKEPTYVPVFAVQVTVKSGQDFFKSVTIDLPATDIPKVCLI